MTDRPTEGLGTLGNHKKFPLTQRFKLDILQSREWKGWIVVLRAGLKIRVKLRLLSIGARKCNAFTYWGITIIIIEIYKPKVF